MKTKSDKLDRIPIHYFNQLQQKIDEISGIGGDVIRLDIGSPDLPPPDFIISSLKSAAIDPGAHGYQPHRGTDDLRRAWAEHYHSNFSVVLDPEKQILPLLGTKEGIFHIPLACIDPGDVVLVPDPGYVTYSRGTLIAGGEPYYFPLNLENNYLPDFSNIEHKIREKASMLWLNYPNNPTGATTTLDFFRSAVNFAADNNLFICHDAAYNQITYNGLPAPSILQVPCAEEFCVEFNSLSKSHNMAGWRIGALVGNPEIINSLYSIKTNADSGHFRPILDAATSALLGDQSWIIDRNIVYNRRRELLMGALEDLGLFVFRSAAGLYVWFKVPEGWSSESFAAAALEKTWIGMTPGTVFGKNGEGYIRLSITVNEDLIRIAIEKLRNWFDKGEV